MCQYHLRPLQKVCLAQACHVTASNKDDKTNYPGNYIAYSEFHWGSKLFSSARSSNTNSHAALLLIYLPAMLSLSLSATVEEISHVLSAIGSKLVRFKDS